ncbi:Peptidase family M48 [Lentzea fradiae]|uniref:Peptidase family M48 n=1 Tax=Lentzea fradiae TaxID=200378 RepID=A0A1G7W8T2_9PSEU|nr:M48 family metalloprotease [Lentzea fradiae]SDG68394.1 Peptidase family M48 [Lentzea fradiae]
METASTQVDERTLAAGTTARFLLLAALLLMSSCLMLLYLFITLTAYDAVGCSLAAGVDLSRDSVHEVVVKRGLQWEAYFSCMTRHAAPPPWWLPVAWLTLLAVLTTALFRMLPWWKSRRTVPLAKMDPDGEVRAALEQLVARAGLTRTPRFVVDPAKLSPQAVVYGRNRRPVVRLNAGLLLSRNRDPRVFEAVVLHELGHVHYRDITITYLTIALWRVYALVALPPFLVWAGTRLYRSAESLSGAVEDPMVTRGLLLTVVMTAFVYLARADVLRHREFYADLAAVRWGADREVWSRQARAERRRAVRDLLSLHPGPAERRTALVNPEVLFGPRPLPLVLTGAAAMVFSTQVIQALTVYVQLSRWVQYAGAAVAAALVVGVAGVALWRAVVHAVLTGHRVPSGLRAGTWLGLGMVLGGVITGQGTAITVWVPDRPVFLLLVLLTAVVFACWTTRCAVLWVSVWRGRTLRPVLALSLTAATLALATWFSWWQALGVALVSGMTFDLAGTRDILATNYLGRTSDSPPLATVDRLHAGWHLAIDNLAGPPLALISVIGLWAVLLLAWLVRPAGGAAWARAAADSPAETVVGTPLPPLRKVLLPALLGGAVAWAAVAAVAAYLHVRIATEVSATRFFTVHLTLTVLSVVAGATIASAVACAWTRTHRLPVALVSGQVAVLLGLAGVYLRAALDGCAGVISIDRTTCGWNPWPVQPTFTFFVTPSIVLGLVASTTVAAVLAALPRTTRHQATRGMFVRRTVVTALCLTALGLGVTRAVALSPQAATMPTASALQREARQWLDDATPSRPPTPDVLALQIDAWADLGGDDLMNRFYRNRRHAFAAVTAYVDSGQRGVTGLGDVRPLCTDISEMAKDAVRYFRVPDPETHIVWQQFVVQAWRASQTCTKALDEQNYVDFNTSMRGLTEAGTTGDRVDDRLDALLEAGR